MGRASDGSMAACDAFAPVDILSIVSCVCTQAIYVEFLVGDGFSLEFHAGHQNVSRGGMREPKSWLFFNRYLLLKIAITWGRQLVETARQISFCFRNFKENSPREERLLENVLGELMVLPRIFPTKEQVLASKIFQGNGHKWENHLQSFPICKSVQLFKPFTLAEKELILYNSVSEKELRCNHSFVIRVLTSRNNYRVSDKYQKE